MPEVELEGGICISFLQLEPIDDIWEIRIFREVVGWVKLTKDQFEITFVGGECAIIDKVEEVAPKAWELYCINLATDIVQRQERDTPDMTQWLRSEDPMAKSSAIFIVREYLRGYSAKPVIGDCPF